MPNITKLSKNEITEINKLYLAKYRKLTGKFIALGPHLTEEAKKAQVLLKTYTIDSNYEGTLISVEDMKKISKTDTPSLTLSICQIKEETNLSNKLLILDAIQDPGNLGTLLRTAKAFNFNTIILGEGTVDIYNDKVIRASQGAIFKLNFIRANILEFMNNNPDYTYYGTSLLNGITPKELTFKEPLALILGNEGNGVNKDILLKTSKNIYIPINDTESLNVSIAGAILMYVMND